MLEIRGLTSSKHLCRLDTLDAHVHLARRASHAFVRDRVFVIGVVHRGQTGAHRYSLTSQASLVRMASGGLSHFSPVQNYVLLEAEFPC